MRNVLILGANGRIARRVSEMFLRESDIYQSHYLRDSERLRLRDDSKEAIIEGDVRHLDVLEQAVATADIVYANLAGPDVVEEARAIIEAMTHTGVRRLIWLSALGVYDEVPGSFGEWNHNMLDSALLERYGEAVDLIEASELDYTIVRLAWLTNKNEIDYELTQKGEPFKGTEVSRKSVAALVRSLIKDPSQYQRASLGINKPHTDGDKPAWY
ncbi:MAG: NAD(P)H-binding protein [Bavariicoccus seileri]|uniref:NAD(P)H-binding protein n=1 Tax=Bavariicoccus seileri TaxID=549685 RepID=UPI0003B46669|nr:NAD(P)H-binding protein [Bavariicoccus seileri]